MNMKKITCVFLFALTLALTSCYKGYYTSEAEQDFSVVVNPDIGSPELIVIPSNSKVVFKKSRKNYYYISCEQYKGYAYKPKFRSTRKRNGQSEEQLIKDTRIADETPKLKDGNTKKYKSSSKESDYNNGAVKVKGYYRKNGTYVRPHTRSVPKSGGSRSIGVDGDKTARAITQARGIFLLPDSSQ